MHDMLSPTTNIEQSAHKAQCHRCQTSNVRVSIVNRSQQEMRTGEPIPLSPSSIEVEESVFNRLSEISTTEKIPLKTLTSRLIMHMLLYHRKEIAELIERIKHPEAW
jgi:hypothetical protein